jgi:hypothetical protein
MEVHALRNLVPTRKVLQHVFPKQPNWRPAVALELIVQFLQRECCAFF